MLNKSSIISRRKKGNKSQIQVDQYTGADWGEKLSFTVGLSYVIGHLISKNFNLFILGGGIGLIRGLYFGVPRNLSLPPRLLLNNLVNSVGKESSRLGNAAGAASFVYYLIGIGLNTFFEEELSNFTQIKKNMICGAITGGIFKSTLGVLPCCVGSILGGASLGCFTHLANYLNKKGKISFEVKF